MSSRCLLPKLSAVFSFPGRILGLSDKGLHYQGSSASDDARKCQPTREIGSRRASEGTAWKAFTPAQNEQLMPLLPGQDWPLRWRPPGPLLRKKKPGCKAGQWEKVSSLVCPRGRAGANEPKCSHNRNGASWSLPVLDLRSLGRTRTAGGVVRGQNTVCFSPSRGSLCGSWPMVVCRTRWTRPVRVTLGRQGRRVSSHICPLFLHPPPLVPGPTLGGP